MEPKWDKYTVFALLGLSIYVAVHIMQIAMLSPGLEGGMDSYNHYLIARFSWIHPSELLLDQWGKPLYNILASPFTQFGLLGSVFFNVLCWLGSAWLCFFTARKLKFKNPHLAFLLCLSSPIFFDNTISGLTEPLCALLLMWSLYLLCSKRFLAGALVAGFLPYARSEGFVIIAVIGFYLLIVERKYRAFAFLLVGSVVMNLIGWMVEGDALWIITENPYIKAQVDKRNLCGQGELLHYVKKLKYVMGKPQLLFFVAGIILFVFHFLKSPKLHENKVQFYLLFGVYALYFTIHSLIWYLGLMGSCGYERVLVVIAPIAAIIGAYFLQILMNWLGVLLPRFSKQIHWASFFFGLMLFIVPHKIYGHKYPIDISDEQKEFVKVAEWYEKQDYADRRHYFLYPYLNILLDIDPKDTDKFIQLWSFDFDYAPLGSIVIWDGHFGPNESRLPLQKLMDHPDFTLIKSFCPEQPFLTSNDYEFEIYIFERTSDKMLKK